MSIRRGRLPPGLLSVFFAAVSATPPILPRATDTRTPRTPPGPTAAPEQGSRRRRCPPPATGAPVTDTRPDGTAPTAGGPEASTAPRERSPGHTPTSLPHPTPPPMDER